MRPHPRERFTPCDVLQVVVVGGLLLLTSVLDRFELMPRASVTSPGERRRRTRLSRHTP